MNATTTTTNTLTGKAASQSSLAGAVTAVIIELMRNIKWGSLYNWLIDAPTNISGTWQLDEWPMAISRDGKTFSLIISPADPRSPVLVGGGSKTDTGIEMFAFQGNDIDGTPVKVSLWLSDPKTLLGKIWKEGEVVGEDAESSFQLVKRI